MAGSTFHEDLSKFEPTVIGGLKKRELIMAFQLIPGTVAIVLEAVILAKNDLLFYPIAIITTLFLMVPFVLKGIGRWEKMKAYFEYDLKNQERVYATNRIRRYEANEFIEKASVKETDSF
jgi:hypothetical protein